jgi:exosortase
MISAAIAWQHHAALADSSWGCTPTPIQFRIRHRGVSDPTRMSSVMKSLGFSFAAIAALVLWAYWPTFAFMYEKWVNDPQYSHGFLVPVFSAWLIYRHRDQLARSRPLPIVGGIIVLVAVAVRVLAGGMLFHQLDAISLLLTLAGLTLACGGWRWFMVVGPAILFLVFMIPLPYEIERNVGGPLKNVATFCSTYLLQTIGYPAIAEGHLILIDEVRLGVVDACSGIKMLTTFAAFSFGAVLLERRSYFERGMVLLGVVPIAVLTNVLRITATGISHTLVHDKATNNFLHDLYGWLMMPLGLVLLTLELWVLKRLVIQPGTK